MSDHRVKLPTSLRIGWKADRDLRDEVLNGKTKDTNSK